MSSSGVHQSRRGFSVLAIQQEEVRFPSRDGLVAARRVKILRIEQPSVLHHQHPGPSFKPIRRLGARSLPRVRALLKPADPRLEAQETDYARDENRVGLRSVGEILRDQAGHFYEVRGQQLQALGELVRDERGRIFELCHSPDNVEVGKEIATSREGANERSTDLDLHSQVHSASTGAAAAPSTPRPQPDSVQHTVRPRTRRSEEQQQLSHRKVLAEPGLYLKLSFSRIKSEMTPQLIHPERLKDSDLIECYAQIYEVQHKIPAAQIAALELGDGALHSQLHPLTRDKAQMLGVPELFEPSRHLFETQASTRQLYAGQRVYRLWPVFDPTAERETNSDKQSA